MPFTVYLLRFPDRSLPFTDLSLHCRSWFLCLEDCGYCTDPDITTKSDSRFASYQGQFVKAQEIVNKGNGIFLKLSVGGGYARVECFSLETDWTWAGVSADSPEKLPCDGTGWWQVDGKKAPGETPPLHCVCSLPSWLRQCLCIACVHCLRG